MKKAKKRSKPSIISIIASVDEGLGIGYKNKLPWDISEDRKWFKEKTLGHVVVMGANTFRSIIGYLGKPLSGRENIVISGKGGDSYEGVHFVDSLERALKLAKKLEQNGEIFFIGGGRVYASAISYTKRLYLTLVAGIHKVDTLFPKYSAFDKVVYEKTGRSGKYKYTFKVLEKTK